MKTIEKAIKHIEDKGVLLVFPIKNKKDPHSLWSCLYPRSEMRWEWDEDGDDRVVNLWHLMKELSVSGRVVYSKWIQNRATFFSTEFFVSLLAYYRHRYDLRKNLLPEARQVLRQLESDSPLSTKEIKELCDLRGRLYEGLYNKSLKQLFQRGLIVGFGEKEDGAFPSALMGASELIFEDLWKKAEKRTLSTAQESLENWIEYSPLLKKQFKAIEKSLVPLGIEGSGIGNKATKK